MCVCVCVWTWHPIVANVDQRTASQLRTFNFLGFIDISSLLCYLSSRYPMKIYWMPPSCWSKPWLFAEITAAQHRTPSPPQLTASSPLMNKMALPISKRSTKKRKPSKVKLDLLLPVYQTIDFVDVPNLINGFHDKFKKVCIPSNVCSLNACYDDFDDRWWIILVSYKVQSYVTWPFNCSKGGGQAAIQFGGDVPSYQYQMAEKPGIKGPSATCDFFFNICVRLVRACLSSYHAILSS